MTDRVKQMVGRADAVSHEIQGLLQGLGPRTQGAILADLVSLWLAGHFEQSELGLPLDSDRPLTMAAREMTLIDFISLVRDLLPESEKEVLQNIEPQGRA